MSQLQQTIIKSQSGFTLLRAAQLSGLQSTQVVCQALSGCSCYNVNVPDVQMITSNGQGQDEDHCLKNDCSSLVQGPSDWDLLECFLTSSWNWEL